MKRVGRASASTAAMAVDFGEGEASPVMGGGWARRGVEGGVVEAEDELGDDAPPASSPRRKSWFVRCGSGDGGVRLLGASSSTDRLLAVAVAPPPSVFASPELHAYRPSRRLLSSCISAGQRA